VEVTRRGYAGSRGSSTQGMGVFDNEFTISDELSGGCFGRRRLVMGGLPLST
jgi:hypothetical protein